jgi:ABC-type lipoprotein export system ATPase subunit
VVIEVRGLFRIYRTAQGDAAALQGLNLDVASGEIVVVLGPSGSGKSTLLRVLAGFEPPSAGTALVLGHDLGALPARRRAALRSRDLGLVDQHYDRALQPQLTCAEIVALPLALRGVPEAERLARADELLAAVELAGAAAARPDELSGGERQRVALCAALAHRPRLLLADEPAGELDAESARAAYALIADLSRAQGTTVLVVSHDATATSIADRTVHVRDGRVSEEDGLLTVDDAGWLRLPEELRLADRVAPERHGDGVLLRAVGGASAPAPERSAAPAPLRTAATPAAPAAELRAVDKAYGDRVVLHGLDAAFPAGRLTAITGRSGSGKSTLLRLLAGLEAPDAGEVLIAGETIAGRDRAALARLRRDRIGVVGQELGLVPFLGARENVVLGLEVRGIAADEAARRATAWLERLGLEHRLGQHVVRLSAGERQRVALARALAAEPAVILVDEPTSRLDEANAALVATLLADVAHEQSAAIVCATHEPRLRAAADEELALEALTSRRVA